MAIDSAMMTNSGLVRSHAGRTGEAATGAGPPDDGSNEVGDLAIRRQSSNSRFEHAASQHK
jgi:hypothetical protein